MMNQFSKVCLDCSKLITNSYSTSFSLGIRMFEKPLRDPIYAIYGYVRFADEIVDTFHEFDKSKLLLNFRLDTFAAIKDGISLNPVLHSFQEVVTKYSIAHELIDAFLDSMEMDLSKNEYNEAEYKKYIYGSAEVIGLMCLKIFVDGDQKRYDELAGYAKALGSAFQKINFLRDIRSDYYDRGRTYFPKLNFENFTVTQKEEIEKDLQQEFEIAYEGIKMLPDSSRLGVYCAYKYYLNLFNKIKMLSPQIIKSQRIRVSDKRKLYLLTTSAFKNKLGML